MLCEDCNQNEATIRLTMIANGERIDRHLCASCAGKQRAQIRLGGMQTLLSALLKSAGIRPPEPETALLRCSGCGTSFEQFRKTSRLGCAQCYQDFRAQLKPVLLRIHGRAQHAGRMPAHLAPPSAVDPIEALRREMDAAVADEDFERAAALRDRIRALSARKEAHVDA